MLNVNIAVFAVALVAFIVSFIMYFHSKNVAITVLKRRGSRVYGELLHHKMKLIDVMDDEKPLADWESVLYSPDEFPRIKKFLYEEYFLLLNYDPFLTGAAGHGRGKRLLRYAQGAGKLYAVRGLRSH